MGELALIGRAAETEIIDRLVGDAFSGRSGVLVLTGEAGAGKSALLAYARARADGMGVLQTAGVQSEAEIEFAALYQLLRPALDGVGSLPPPQSAAPPCCPSASGSWAPSTPTLAARGNLAYWTGQAGTRADEAN